MPNSQDKSVDRKCYFVILNQIEGVEVNYGFILEPAKIPGRGERLGEISHIFSAGATSGFFRELTEALKIL